MLTMLTIYILIHTVERVQQNPNMEPDAVPYTELLRAEFMAIIRTCGYSIAQGSEPAINEFIDEFFDGTIPDLAQLLAKIRATVPCAELENAPPPGAYCHHQLRCGTPVVYA